MKKLSVSYILGIYNAERTLKDCLNGIFMQDFPKKDYEVIVIDGGSTDSTIQIVKGFMKKHKNLKLLHNPKKLSEGKGMSKDMGVKASKGDLLIFLDHDNIVLGKNWLKKMIFPFEDDQEIMATQSFLQFKENNSNFLKYVNALGVEDAFAVPYSLVAQVTLHPKKFNLIKNNYYSYVLNKNPVLFGGANGCIFKKEVFKRIGGYTRDVNNFESMADQAMKVAVVKNAKVYHNTGSNFLIFLKKKALYFYRFIDYGYKEENYKWVGPKFRDKIEFYLRVMLNLTVLVPFVIGLKQFIKTKRFFWLLHPFYVFTMTALYSVLTLYSIKSYFKYVSKKD